MDEKELFLELGKDFKECSSFFEAIGDSTRQQIIMSLIKAGPDGIRVGDIANESHLSRPAVSHHLKILKDAEIAHIRKVGTMNYYYICIRSLLPKLSKAHLDLVELVKILPEE